MGARPPMSNQNSHDSVPHQTRSPPQHLSPTLSSQTTPPVSQQGQFPGQNPLASHPVGMPSAQSVAQQDLVTPASRTSSQVGLSVLDQGRQPVSPASQRLSAPSQASPSLDAAQLDGHSSGQSTTPVQSL